MAQPQGLCLRRAAPEEYEVEDLCQQTGGSARNPGGNPMPTEGGARVVQWAILCLRRAALEGAHYSTCPHGTGGAPVAFLEGTHFAERGASKER